MNIAFFLLPKEEVIYVTPRTTMRQALERMERHRYNAVPIIDQDGRYVGTITEGDLLWKMKNTPELNFSNTHTIRVEDIPQYKHHQPVRIDARIEDLIALMMEQNFVPVIDERGIFIGIVRRKEVLEYCARGIAQETGEPDAPPVKAVNEATHRRFPFQTLRTSP
ncbi:MAG: CBS domain-containing protein [Candidatus Carbobacillus altaicus]|uniref:Inosine-5'-monophosphate dehydrogenase n=1 Tax=Candidatus Carbonibacillus altaicus TaxID=2163959 RepID=A0A2R6Y146_9BACL|nr:CBS domain-containing protein [Candidatus Carbobacillus altaicus]PTQ56408.1 MAG: Inosine-5'-monophosphate dehydrogenase [Candidatus Carbobacillus altaicus]